MKICCCQMYSGNKIMISSENATFAYIQSEQYVWHMKWYPRKLERQVEVCSSLIYILCIWDNMGAFRMICELHQNSSQLQCCSRIDLFVCIIVLFCWQHNNRLEFTLMWIKKIWCRKVANRVHWIIMANWYGCYTTKQLAWTTHTLTHLPILMV